MENEELRRRLTELNGAREARLIDENVYVDQIIKLFARSTGPMGYSNWLEHGEKYGYLQAEHSHMNERKRP